MILSVYFIEARSQSDFNAKIEYIIRDVNDSQFQEELFLEMKNILDNAVLDLKNKESDLYE